MRNCSKKKKNSRHKHGFRALQMSSSYEEEEWRKDVEHELAEVEGQVEVFFFFFLFVCFFSCSRFAPGT